VSRALGVHDAVVASRAHHGGAVHLLDAELRLSRESPEAALEDRLEKFGVRRRDAGARSLVQQALVALDVGAGDRGDIVLRERSLSGSHDQLLRRFLGARAVLRADRRRERADQ
jgi:hypothetical protein